jgi:DNA-binding XRE family transcriptional regulator
MKSNENILGTIIKERRMAIGGLTQEILANIVDCDITTIGRIERGAEPSFYIAGQLAAILDFSLDQILEQRAPSFTEEFLRCSRMFYASDDFGTLLDISSQEQIIKVLELVISSVNNHGVRCILENLISILSEASFQAYLTSCNETEISREHAREDIPFPPAPTIVITETVKLYLNPFQISLLVGELQINGRPFYPFEAIANIIQTK